MNNDNAAIPFPARIMTALPEMSAAEAMCTMVLVAETYGCGRKRAWLTYAHFQKKTMYKGKGTILRALKAVINRGFFRRRKDEGSNWEIIDEYPGQSTSFFAAEGLKMEPEGSISAGDSAIPAKYSSALEPDSSNVNPEQPQPAANGPKTGPQDASSGPKTEPLPFNKDKVSTGDRRERESKDAPTRARARMQYPGYNGRKPTAMPLPRTVVEKALARHPATKAWLACGLAWPGWERLEMITERIGNKPQAGVLCQARKLWMMAGYRTDNIGGILDWYTALCRDPNWQPFQSGQRAYPRAGAGYGPSDPTMAMLLDMQKEYTHGKQGTDQPVAAAFEISLPKDAFRAAIGAGLPVGAG